MCKTHQLKIGQDRENQEHIYISWTECRTK